MRWRAAARTGQLPRSPQVFATSLIANTGDLRRNHLVMLAEILCHSGDIRIPLGLPFEPDPQLTVIALDFLTGPVPIGLVNAGTKPRDSLARHRRRPNMG